jgi:hypothetical protein
LCLRAYNRYARHFSRSATESSPGSKGRQRNYRGFFHSPVLQQLRTSAGFDPPTIPGSNPTKLTVSRTGIATLPVRDRRDRDWKARLTTGITTRIGGSSPQIQERDRHPARQLSRATDRCGLEAQNRSCRKNFNRTCHPSGQPKPPAPYAPGSQAPSRTRAPTAGTLLARQN